MRTTVITANAIASRLPDYDVVGTPSAPAHPGDLLALWDTGFGPTSPAAPAGLEVSGGVFATGPLTLTIGSMQLQVPAAYLTPGTAGLYQIHIQLPMNIPAGTVTLQASTGGAATPAGVTLVMQ